MRHKGLIEIALIGGVLLLIVNMPPGLLSSIVSKAFTQDKAVPAEEITQAPTLKTFRAPDGTEASLDISVLSGFTYPGDAEFCAFASKYNAAIASEPNIMEDCDAFAALEPTRKSTELVQAAQESALQAQVGAAGKQIGGISSVPNDPPAGKAMGLALSALHEAISLMPADAIDDANAAFGSHLGELKFVDHQHKPDFLFEDALTAEFGRARIELCRLMKKDDCLAQSSTDLAEALMSVGRWKSDVGSLVLSADIAEAIHKSLDVSDPDLEFDFADQFAGSLGYAAEVAKGDAGLAYSRRSVVPLEKWYHEHKTTYGDKSTLASAAQTLGSNYGRMAFKTRTAADVAKCLEYDGDAYRLEGEIDGNPSWEITINYGDSFVLKGEVDNNEPDIIKGLDLQRQALAKTLAEKGPEDHAYARMKVAQTLSRYVRVRNIDVSRDGKIEMLSEGKRLALEAQAFFKTTGTPVYIDYVAGIIEDIESAMRSVGKSS